MSGLPKGWQPRTLSKVVRPRRQKAQPSSLEVKPFLGLEHVESNSARILGRGLTSDVKSAVALFEPGDVLYSRLRPYLNKVVRPDFAGAASAEFIVMPENEEIDGSFLHRLLMQPAFLHFASHINQGDRPRVDFSQIGEFEFGLPPLPVQRRIVAKLDRLLARTKAAREELARVPKLVERYKQAVLEKAFANTNASEQALGDLISSGPQNGLYLPKTAYGSGTPILRIENFGFEGAQPRFQWKQVQIPPDQVGRYDLQSNDVVINRVNSPSHLGKSMVVSEAHVPAVFESNMMRIRLRPEVCVEYIQAFLASDIGRRRLIKDAKWAVNQASINQDDVRRTLIPIPSLTEQTLVVQKIATMNVQMFKAIADLARATTLLDRLDQATLTKAFRGELKN
jgi:type I restriction enzyme S subunit